MSIPSNLHDEVATNLLWKGNDLCLELKHYDDDKKTYVPYSILFCGIRTMAVDHVQTKYVTPPSESGDVLRYKETDGKASLLIEWHDFKNRAKFTKLYEFDFDSRQINGI